MNPARNRQLTIVGIATLVALIASFAAVSQSDGPSRQVAAVAGSEQPLVGPMLHIAGVSPGVAQLAAARAVSLDMAEVFYKEKVAAPLGDLPEQF